MTGAAAGIAKLTARYGKELPVIAGRVERKPDHPERPVVLCFGVGCGHISKSSEAVASGSDHELADLVNAILDAVRRLRREPFVAVFVGIHDDVSPALVKRLPKRF